MAADCPELGRFVRGEIPAAAFPHREHVRMAFEMLKRHDFPETALDYSRALRAMAEQAGRPEAFHHTVTIAFLSLIAERMEAARANPDLIESGARALVPAGAAGLRTRAAYVPAAGPCASRGSAARTFATAGLAAFCAAD